MNDDFLYRLRVDPPLEFAVRLKTRLDTQARVSGKRVGRWGIPLLIFGAAFALGLPGVRHAIARLVSDKEVAAESPREVSRAVEPTLTEHEVTGSRVGDADDTRQTRADPGSRRLRVNRPAQQLPPTRVRPQDEAPVGESEDLTVDSEQAQSRAPLNTDSVIAHSSTTLDEAQAALVQRRSVFATMSHETVQLFALAPGGRSFDPDAVETHVQRIEELALTIPAAFALDTRGFVLETEARDTIWTEKAQFDADARRLATAAAVLVQSSHSGDTRAISLAMGNLSVTCAGCHQAYRVEPR